MHRFWMIALTSAKLTSDLQLPVYQAVMKAAPNKIITETGNTQTKLPFLFLN